MTNSQPEESRCERRTASNSEQEAHGSAAAQVRPRGAGCNHAEAESESEYLVGVQLVEREAGQARQDGKPCQGNQEICENRYPEDPAYEGGLRGRRRISGFGGLGLPMEQFHSPKRTRSPARPTSGVPKVSVGVRPTSMVRSKRFSADAKSERCRPRSRDA